MKTIVSEHWAGQLRGHQPNGGTRIASVVQLARPDLRALFEHAYPAFAAACRAVDEPGLALVAIDERSGRASGLTCLRARVDRYVTAIVGRHDRSDLFIAGEERLALRQLAVVLDPVHDWRAGSAEVSFRMLDLRTAEGMIDEEGRPLRGLRSEGPAVVRCGGYVIYALPLGDPTDWPASASLAWEYMPERVYHDELARIPDASVVRPMVVPGRHATRIVTRTSGPRTTAMRLVSGQDLAGRLVVRSSRGSMALDVGHQALREGVLIGRYPRCDGRWLDDEPSLSRVHALLLRVGDRLLAIDVASTNGTRFSGGSDARVLELRHGAEMELGESVVARWRWAP